MWKRRPSPPDQEPASLSSLVELGLTPAAVDRVISDPPPADVLRAELRTMRLAGHTFDADVIELVVDKPAARQLLSPDELFRYPVPLRHRLVVPAIVVVWVALIRLHPLLGLLVPVSIVVVVLRWLRARRTQLDDREWQIVLDWTKARLPKSSAAQRKLLLAAAVVIGLLAVLSLTMDSASAAFLAGLAAILAVGALHPWLAGPAETAPDTRPADPRRASPWVAGAHGPTDGPTEPLLIRRPAFVVSAMPAVLAALLAALLVFHTHSPSDLPPLLIALLVTGWLGFRAATSRVTLDDRGVAYRGIWRTRRFDWDQIVRLHTRGDGQGRARVEVVLDSEERSTIWSGSVDAPVLPRLATYGDDLVRGEPGGRRVGRGCAVAFAVVLALFGTLFTVSALTTGSAVSVDPDSVPAGVDAWVLVDEDGEPTSQPRVECAAILRSSIGWEPPTWEDVRRDRLWLATGAGIATVALWTVVIAAHRSRRRREAVPAPGPLPAGPRP